MSLVSDLGARALDYNSKTIKEEIIAEGPFDVVLSCVDTELSRWSDNIMGIWRNCVHVSVVSPLLADADRYGLPLGLASTAAKYFLRSYEVLRRNTGEVTVYHEFSPPSEDGGSFTDSSIHTATA